MGDLAYPCFPLAKALRKAPPAIAVELAEAFTPTERVAAARAVGPYLNFTLRREAFAAWGLERFAERGEAAFVDADAEEGTTVAIDFSSPNIAKPFGIGHLRSTMIGNALARIHTARGARAVRINHLGDWGTQFGSLIAAWERWGDEEAFARDPIGTLYALYVRFHTEEEREAPLREEARERFRRLETGDPAATPLWKRFREASLAAFGRIYERLGVSFDEDLGESHYAKGAAATIAWLEGAGVVSESDGATVVELPGEELPPLLLRKGDGTTLYATRDVAAARDRWERYRFDRMLYVVGAPQRDHFRQLFAALARAGCDWADRCEHVAFGHYQGMSTRKGTIVLLEEVLGRAVELAGKKMREALAEGLVDLPEPEIPEAARKVGIGAVVFNDLSTKRHKDVAFDWETLLNFRGRTGPYVQYAHARTCGILRKSGLPDGRVPDDAPLDPAAATSDAEHALLLDLFDLPRTVGRAAVESEPSLLAAALLDLCKRFTAFYDACPVLQAPEPVRSTRLRLVAAARAAIRQGLFLLGVEAPEKM